MKNFFLKFFILAAMLLGLPLLGVMIAGFPVSRYLEFPPESRYVAHAPFSWAAFTVYSVFILAVVGPLMVRTVRSILKFRGKRTPARPFPWWGRLGVAVGAVSWVLAWSRFSWFALLQPHTFTPLWISFILVVNALSYRRDGRCMLIDRTGYFLLLFPASAAFWWFFEYLNRFVQNWHYTGSEYGALAYFCLATLSFSTVLPAVLGAREWLDGASWIRRGFEHFLPIKIGRTGAAAWAVLLISAGGLAGIGIWPDYLFPLLWVSPLLIILSVQSLAGERHPLAGIAAGDWRPTVSAAAAALLCGGFWEMWNIYSLARWEYAVPFVDRFKIFEMPLLGYAGYLPFGLECAAVGEMLERMWEKGS